MKIQNVTSKIVKFLEENIGEHFKLCVCVFEIGSDIAQPVLELSLQTTWFYIPNPNASISHFLV